MFLFENRNNHHGKFDLLLKPEFIEFIVSN